MVPVMATTICNEFTPAELESAALVEDVLHGIQQSLEANSINEMIHIETGEYFSRQELARARGIIGAIIQTRSIWISYDNKEQYK